MIGRDLLVVSTTLLFYCSLTSCSRDNADRINFQNLIICDDKLWSELIGQNKLSNKDYNSIIQLKQELKGNYKVIKEAIFHNPLHTGCDELSSLYGNKYPMIRMTNEYSGRVVEAFWIKKGGKIKIQLRGRPIKNS